MRCSIDFLTSLPVSVCSVEGHEHGSGTILRPASHLDFDEHDKDVIIGAGTMSENARKRGKQRWPYGMTVQVRTRRVRLIRKQIPSIIFFPQY